MQLTSIFIFNNSSTQPLQKIKLTATNYYIAYNHGSIISKNSPWAKRAIKAFSPYSHMHGLWNGYPVSSQAAHFA